MTAFKQVTRAHLASLLADVREWNRTHRTAHTTPGAPEVEAKAVESAKGLLAELDGVRATVIEHAEERYLISMHAMDVARAELVTFDSQSQGALASTRLSRQRAETAFVRAREHAHVGPIIDALYSHLEYIRGVEGREIRARAEARKQTEARYLMAQQMVIQAGSDLLAVFREQLPKLEVMVDLAELNARDGLPAWRTRPDSLGLKVVGTAPWSPSTSPPGNTGEPPPGIPEVTS